MDGQGLSEGVCPSSEDGGEGLGLDVKRDSSVNANGSTLLWWGPEDERGEEPRMPTGASGEIDKDSGSSSLSFISQTRIAIGCSL